MGYYYKRSVLKKSWNQLAIILVQLPKFIFQQFSEGVISHCNNDEIENTSYTKYYQWHKIIMNRLKR